MRPKTPFSAKYAVLCQVYLNPRSSGAKRCSE